MTVGEKVSDNVNLLSFGKASAIFEKMMPTVYLGRLKSENSGDHTFSYEINITSVKLCLMQVRDNGSEKSGLLVPAWVFYGEWWEFPNWEPENKRYFDSPPYVLMAVNAVDGTLIDPWEGY